MERILHQINERFIPDDRNFTAAIEAQFEEHPDVSRDEFIRTAFQRMLFVLDQEVKTIENNVSITANCTEGCSHCCYNPIILTKVEAKLITQHIEEMPQPQKQQLITQLETYYTSNYLEKVMQIDFQTDQNYKLNYIKKQIPCPMLDQETKSCKIYDVRPVQCRTHKNYCDPKVCADHPIPDEVFSYEFLYEYYIYALVNTIQETIFENENDPIHFPTDVYEANYLPTLFQELLPVLKGGK